MKLCALWAMPLLLVATGCYRTFLPPPPAGDPVEFWFVQEAWHKGVVLPTADGQREEWGMGEWAWYAEGANRWTDMPRAVLWPSRTALSRRVLPFASPAEMVAAQQGTRVFAFTAERERVRALRGRLEELWRAGLSLADGDPDVGLVRNGRGERFVPVDRGYWMFWNCNDAAADWLRALGCQVGSAVQSWSLAPRQVADPAAGRRPVRIYLAPPPGGAPGESAGNP